MKDKMKRALSLVLTMVMLVSMITVPVAAENSAGIQLSFANGTWENDVYTVDVVASAAANEFDLYSAEIHLSFDKSVLNLAGSQAGDISGVDYKMEDVKSANDRGSFALIIADNAKTNHTVTSGVNKLVTLQFAKAEGVESCDTKLSFACQDGERNILGYYDNGNKNYSVDADATLTVTVVGVAPILEAVFLDKKAVTVDGENGATSQASAFSARGTDVTDKVSWSVDEIPEGASVNDVNIDASGKITVDAKAVAGEYTVTANPEGEGFCTGGVKTATLTVERAAAAAKNIAVKKDGELLPAEMDTIKVPASGANVYTYSVAMKDQYGDDFTGKVEWEFEVVDGTGSVSFDDETGKLTVPADVSTDASFKLTAKCGDATAVISISTLADIYLNFANGKWVDGEYTVDVVAAASEADTFDLYSAEIHLSFDKSVLNLAGSQAGDISGVDYKMEDVKSANDRGSFALIVADNAKTNHTVMSGVTKLVTLRFTEAYGVEGCDTELSFACGEAEHNVLGYYDNGNKNYSLNDKVSVSVAVKGTDPVLGEVSFDKSEVTVDGDKDVTVQASAFSLKGTNVTSRVTWSVEPAGRGVSIDPETGSITVSAKAEAQAYTVTAAPEGEGVCSGEPVRAVLTVVDFMPPVMDENDPEYENVTGASIKEAVPNGDGTVSFQLEITAPTQKNLTYLVWIVGENGSEDGELASVKVEAGTSTYTVPQDTTLQVYVLGDINSDGKVSAADASRALGSIAAHLAANTEAEGLEKAIGNFDCQGDFGSADVSALLKFVAKSLAGG